MAPFHRSSLVWCGFAIVKECDFENQLKETACFPAPHWEDAPLFEALYHLLRCNFIISAYEVLYW